MTCLCDRADRCRDAVGDSPASGAVADHLAIIIDVLDCVADGEGDVACIARQDTLAQPLQCRPGAATFGQHIDEDLFKLFLTSGVYKDYAKMYLLPEQLDEVDIEQYLS